MSSVADRLEAWHAATYENAPCQDQLFDIAEDAVDALSVAEQHIAELERRLEEATAAWNVLSGLAVQSSRRSDVARKLDVALNGSRALGDE